MPWICWTFLENLFKSQLTNVPLVSSEQTKCDFFHEDSKLSHNCLFIPRTLSWKLAILQYFNFQPATVSRIKKAHLLYDSLVEGTFPCLYQVEIISKQLHEKLPIRRTVLWPQRYFHWGKNLLQKLVKQRN